MVGHGILRGEGDPLYRDRLPTTAEERPGEEGPEDAGDCCVVVTPPVTWRSPERQRAPSAISTVAKTKPSPSNGLTCSLRI
jgi:hypothetical protein